jgi:hypothetical protein
MRIRFGRRAADGVFAPILRGIGCCLLALALSGGRGFAAVFESSLLRCTYHGPHGHNRLVIDGSPTPDKQDTIRGTRFVRNDQRIFNY